MSNELVQTKNALSVNKIEYNKEQVALIKSQIAPKATDQELQLFLYQCQRTGLDALSRQIYAIHRWNGTQKKEVMTIQTSIDGFRVVAERSGDYGGQSEPEFIEKDGKLQACKITVFRFRGDQRYPASVGVAYWDEYKQTDKEGKVIGLWAKMPRVMLSKVAEALALRKAYPQDLSGLYTAEEIEQSGVVQTEDIPHTDVPPAVPQSTKPAESKLAKPPVQTPQEEQDKINEWLTAIAGYSDLETLTRNFNANKAYVNNTPQVYEAFKKRKQELTKQPA
jgi:phage recombination protein Bet